MSNLFRASTMADSGASFAAWLLGQTSHRTVLWQVATCAGILAFVLNVPNGRSVASEVEPYTPVAITRAGNGYIVIANREQGSLSIIDAAQQKLLNELPVASKLVDVVAFPDGSLVAADGVGAVFYLHWKGKGAWRMQHETQVAPYPVELLPVVIDGATACISASLWSRTIEGWSVSKDAAFTSLGKLQLPFEPRKLHLLSCDRLLVTSAFDARLAVVDLGDWSLAYEAQLPGHNVRGIASDADKIYLAMQQLNPLAHSTRDDVHWGNMISNRLVTIEKSTLLEMDSEELSFTVHELGGPGEGAGDPGPLSIQPPNSKSCILLTGVHEIGLFDPQDPEDLTRVQVGRTPVDMAFFEDLAFVANSFDASISVVDLTVGTEVNRISLNETPHSDSVAGEALFYDATLALDGWMSCHSCHTDGHTNRQLNDNLSDGSFGAPKRVLSLLGVGQTGPWAWNGQVNALEDQIKASVKVTMQGGAEPTPKQTQALAEFLRGLNPPHSIPMQGKGSVAKTTLPPPSPTPNAKTDIVVSSPSAKRGRQTFERLSCSRCHIPPTYTSKKAYDVGLVDEAGNRMFNPPSLRGVGQRPNLFHDGRAQGLYDVLIEHQHQLEQPLSAQEWADLEHFLQLL